MVKLEVNDYKYCLDNVRDFKKIYNQALEKNDRMIYLHAISDEIDYDGFDDEYFLTKKGNILQDMYDKYYYEGNE